MHQLRMQPGAALQEEIVQTRHLICNYLAISSLDGRKECNNRCLDLIFHYICVSY